jgi:hypothetical protein
MRFYDPFLQSFPDYELISECLDWQTAQTGDIELMEKEGQGFMIFTPANKTFLQIAYFNRCYRTIIRDRCSLILSTKLHQAGRCGSVLPAYSPRDKL